MGLGRVRARVSTFGIVCDKSFLFLPGSIEDGCLVFISMAEHGVMKKDASVGMGALYAEGDALIFTGRYDVHTARGRAAFDALRMFGDRVRWSIGFNILEATTENRDGREVRIIARADPFEVSPVGDPADPCTYTLELDGRPLPGARLPTRALIPEGLVHHG